MNHSSKFSCNSGMGTTVSACMFSCVRLFMIPWTIAHEAPLSMGFHRQDCWSGLPFPTPGTTINKFLLKNTGLPWWLRWLSVCRQRGRPGFDPWVGKIPWRRKWQPTPVLLPEVSYGWTSLVGYSPWGCKKLDTTERLHLLQKKGFPRWL